MAEEVRNPGRNLPLALALGTGAVTVIYILINVLYLKVIPDPGTGDVEGERARRRRGAADRRARRRRDGHRLDHRPGGERERDDVCRPARLLRDGPRRCLPAGRGAHPSDLQDAVDLDRRAGGLGDDPDPDRQPRRARQLRRVRDHAVRRDRGRRGVRAAGARAARAAAVQGDWLSADAGDLRALQRRHGGQRDLSPAAGHAAWASLLIAAGIPLYFWFTKRAKGGP